MTTDDSRDQTGRETLYRRLEQLSDLMRGSRREQLEALAEFDGHREQVFAALDDVLERGRHTEALRLIASCARYWWMRGFGPRVQDRVDAALEAADPQPNDLLFAMAQFGAGELLYAQSHYERARRAFGGALRTFAELRETVLEAHAINGLGLVDREQGRYTEARKRHRRAREVYAGKSHEWGRANSISNLGVVAYRLGELDESIDLHEQALAIRRSIDDLQGICSSLGNLAAIHRRRGDLERARSMYAESLAGREQLGDNWGIAGSHVNLCQVTAELGDIPAAREHLARALTGFETVGDSLGIAESAEAAVAMFVAEGSLENAGVAFAVSEAVRRCIAAPLPQSEHGSHTELVDRVREALGRETFAELRRWAAGADVDDARAKLRGLLE